MKVQDLLPGSKPSPSSRAARSGASEGRPTDFAGALTEARRKPDPKPAETEAPAAKKSAPARKKSAKDEPAPADADAAPSEATATEEDETPVAAVEGGEPVAETGEPVEGVDEETAEESALAEGKSDWSAIAMTEFVGPQVLPTAVATEAAEVVDAEPADDGKQIICPPGSQRRIAEQMHSDADDNDAQSDDAVMPLDLDELARLDGFDDFALPQEEGVDQELDPTLAAKAPAPVKQPTASVAPVAGDNAPPPESNDTDKKQAQLQAVSSEFPIAADGSEEPGSSSAVAPTSPDVTNSNATPTTAVANVQAEPAKPQATPAAPAPQPPAPQAHFVEANHPKIVTAVRGELLPHGGSMQIRLDPPELGALQVMVHMQDGVMTASFQTSNDDATRLLSHSLSQLKQVLESQGVSVEKLQVQQAPKDQQAGNQNEDGQHQRDQHGDAHRQEQQRKDMLRRMWRRLANGSDPLDLVA